MNCKHIYAARFVMRREQNADGSVNRDQKRYILGENYLSASMERTPPHFQEPSLGPMKDSPFGGLHKKGGGCTKTRH
jgi:hypothetical protein